MHVSLCRFFVAVTAVFFVLTAAAQTNQPGSALQFDGINDYALVSSNTGSFNSLPMTVMAWVNTTQANNSGIINKYRSGSLNGWQLFLVSGELRAWYFANGGNYVWDGANGLNGGTINDGRWHHIAFTVDSTGGKLYVDGVLKQSRPWTGTPGVCTTIEPLLFGDYPGTGAYYSGKLDEVSYWQTALSESSIQSYMHQSLAGNEANLTGYWRFDEGTASTANDLAVAGGNSPAALKGATWTASAAGIGIPGVTMLPTANETYMSVDIISRVEPRARESVTWFQWSPASDLSSAPIVSIQTNAPADAFLITNRITGQLRGTRIYYRAAATNSSGIAYGAVTNFLLPVLAPAATTVGASNVTTTSAVLHGNVHSHGVMTWVAFQYGTTTNLGQSVSADYIPPAENPTNVQASVSGLLPKHTYYYRVRGANDGGISFGNILQFTTPASPPSLVLSNISFSVPTARLSATVNPNSTATGARFEYGSTATLGEATPWQAIGEGSAPAPISATLSNISVGDFVFYRLIATNSIGVTTSEVRSVSVPLFAAQGHSFPSFRYGAAAWADYDNDGDQDLVIGGDGNTRLLRNQGGSFSVITNNTLPGVEDGTFAWGDYNCDGLLDLLIAESDTAAIYPQNSSAAGTFNAPVSLPWPGFAAAAVWGDFDNNGFLDAAVMGSSYGKIFSQRPDRTFAESATFHNVGGNGPNGCGLAAGDVNGDGYLDLAMAGAGRTRIALNDGNGQFIDVDPALPGYTGARIALADFDRDGALDILLTGRIGSTGYSKVFRNTSSGNSISFAEIPSNLFGVGDAGMAVADFDNDGWPDFIFAGAWAGNWGTRFYRNEGGTNFVEYSTAVRSLVDPTFAAGDVNNDSRLDLLAMGFDIVVTNGNLDEIYVSDIFTNNFSRTNTRPIAPSNLQSVVNGRTVTLSWDPATDAETASASLTYELRIGRTAHSSNVAAAPAAGDGVRRIFFPGSISRTSFVFKPEQAGAYTWSVQAVDGAFAGSPFSTNNSFHIGFPPEIVSVSPPIQFQPTRLPAVVNAHGANTSGYFEWGATTNYGERTPNFNIGDITYPIPIAYNIGNQPAASTFHFRVVLSNEFGVVVSPDVVYTVPHFEIVPVREKPATDADAVRWADLNGDGILDAIVKNRAYRYQINATVDNGTWVPFPQGTVRNINLENVSVSDVQRSGGLDFAVGGQFTDLEIQLWKRQGTGFTYSRLPILSEFGLAFPGIAFGDYNNDGRPDLIAGAIQFPGDGVDQVHLVRQEADGSFALVSTNGLPGSTYAGFWGDYNRDGWLDYAGSGLKAGVAVNQSGTNLVTTELISSGNSDAGWADYNNDGWLDLALGARLYRNTNGTLVPVEAPAIPHTYFGGQVKWGDLNGDGLVDLIFGRNLSGTFGLAYWRNQGDGTFAEETFVLPAVNYGKMDVGDFEGNGRLDILLAPGSGELTVLRNLISTNNLPPAAPTNIVAALGQDGTASFSWNAAVDPETPAAGLSYNLRIFHPDGSRLFSPEANANGRVSVPKPGRWQLTNVSLALPLTNGVYRAEVQAVDHSFNGSQFASVKFGPLTNAMVTTLGANNSAVTNATLSGRVIPMGNTTAAWFEWGTSTNYGFNTATQLLAGDFEQYGVTNLITDLVPGSTIHYRLVGSNAFGLSYGTNLSFTVPRMTATPTGGFFFSSSLNWADFNNDGNMDIAGVLDFSVNVLYGDGAGGFTNVLIDADPIYGPMMAADFDNDGFVDLLASGGNDIQSITRMWRNNGDGTFARYPVNIAAGWLWGGAAAADFNNDGAVDVVTHGSTGSEIWLNQGAGQFEKIATVGSSGNFGQQFSVADFDRDGDVDLFNAGGEGLWRNDGSNQFVHVPLTGHTPVEFQTSVWGDFDGDGWQDLVVADDFIVRIWHNQAGVLTLLPSDQQPNPINGGGVAFADFDGNGRADLLLTGFHSEAVAELWSRSETGWEILPLPGAPVDGIARLLPADYNNDGRVDFAQMGPGGFTLHMVQNHFATARNQRPDAPSDLTATVSTNGMIHFSWTAPADNASPSNSLRYALRIGTAPGRGDVLSAHALTNGSRQVLELPLLSTNSWNTRLRYGRYYWSVQAIDAGLLGGPFASEAFLDFDPLRPRLLSVTNDAGGIRARFEGAPNVTYGVEGASTLTAPVWENLGSVLSGPNGLFELLDSSTNSISNRFYRVTYPGAP